jgi:hypothetical protein
MQLLLIETWDIGHIKLNPTAQKVSTVIYSLGKYNYKRLPMEIKITTNVFQQIKSKLII